MSRYVTFDMQKTGQVATIRMLVRGKGQAGNPIDELASVFSELRDDDSVRVIVLTSDQDDLFSIAYPTETKRDPGASPHGIWRAIMGIVRCYMAMAEIEKPIVARVNGDAIGLGQSLMFGCDIIVAREDAKISDVHLGMGTVVPTGADGPVGPAFGVAPGDGGGALIPLFMTPTKAKEYMMLSLERTARELADDGIINHAVAAERLDEVVDDIVARLLTRSAYALAYAKRILNRHVLSQLNLTLDAAVAYQFVNMLQVGALGDDDTTL